MPRQEARNYINPDIKELACYHGSHFDSLKGFNSDRNFNLDPDYTMSRNNTASALSIISAGARFKWLGIEWENVSPLKRSAGSTVYCNLLHMMIEMSGFPKDFWRIEADGSVDAECITQTFSKGWLRNNYKSFKALYECCSAFGVTTDDHRCGMHVNLDISWFGADLETQLDNIRKLSYLINKHYDFFCVAFHRDRNHTTYCGRMTSTKEYWKNFNFENAVNDHYISMNLSHVLRQKRVEIRLVAGQKDYFGFRNTMETVFHIVERVSKLSWNDLDNLEKVLKGCNTYVFKRISTDCLRANVISQELVEKIFPTVKEVNYL